MLKRTPSRSAALAVTEANKLEYLQLHVAQWLVGAIQDQIDAFRAGLDVFFVKGVRQEVQQCCTAAELQLLLCGVAEIDVGDWEQSAQYQGGLTADTPVARWFWSVVRQFDREERAKLLHFCTGSSRAPAAGFAELQGHTGAQSRFRLISVAGDGGRLPTAQTCFNTLRIPNYTSEQQLREKLEMAMHCA